MKKKYQENTKCHELKRWRLKVENEGDEEKLIKKK